MLSDLVATSFISSHDNIDDGELNCSYWFMHILFSPWLSKKVIIVFKNMCVIAWSKTKLWSIICLLWHACNLNLRITVPSLHISKYIPYIMKNLGQKASIVFADFCTIINGFHRKLTLMYELTILNYYSSFSCISLGTA